MAFLDLFRNRTQDVVDPKVLVCSLDSAFEAELVHDSDTYKQYFQSVTVQRFADADELLNSLRAEYDIVHVLAAVTPDGYLGYGRIAGTELIERSTNWGTKLLWIASDNDPDGYIKNFKPNGNKLNLVMTIQRRGEHFPSFLNRLLIEMRSGASMPVAWGRIVPQIPGQEHPDAPDTIFFAGLGQVRFT